MKNVKRKLRPSIKNALYIIAVILIATSIFKVGGNLFKKPTGNNENSKRVKIDNCIAYYPKDSDNLGKTYAQNLCDGNQIEDEEVVFDYTISHLNNFQKIDYGKGQSYLVDENFLEPKLGELSEKGQMIISDYLRYTLKAKDLDYGYTSHFLEESYYPNISLDLVDDYHFDGDNLYLLFEKYDVEVKIPLKYIAKEVGIDLGLNGDDYIKPSCPVSINPDRKTIALTFDDGPSLDPECTDKILNELYKYDAVGTFYVVGSRLYDQTEDIIEKGISLGNAYGSHTCNHPNLTGLPAEEAYDEVMDVAKWFKEKFNYEIKTYRPPFGAYNEAVDNTIPLTAVLWDIDSIDWQLRDANAIIEEIGEDIPNHAVVIMHDIHASTAEALVDQGLIKKLIDQGYRLVCIDDVAELRNFEFKQGAHLCWDH